MVLGLAAITVAIAPAAAWYAHAYRTADPDGPLAAHVYYSVRTSADVHRPPDPLLRSPDFYRQVLDDLAGVVLTPIGLVLVLAGFLDRAWRRRDRHDIHRLVLCRAGPDRRRNRATWYRSVLSEPA